MAIGFSCFSLCRFFRQANCDSQNSHKSICDSRNRKYESQIPERPFFASHLPSPTPPYFSSSPPEKRPKRQQSRRGNSLSPLITISGERHWNQARCHSSTRFVSHRIATNPFVSQKSRKVRHKFSAWRNWGRNGSLARALPRPQKGDLRFEEWKLLASGKSGVGYPKIAQFSR